MSHRRRIKALECRLIPLKMTTERRDGWVYIFWGHRLIRVIHEALYDAI